MNPVAGSQEHAERFTHLRPLLFTIAYEILGTASEADDVLQESYLRWAGVDLSTVRDTKSYLAQLVTRQSLNALRSAARRREEYVGPWLPEPILVSDGDPLDDVVLAEAVSMAMLVVLESLTPDERAVFVLHEVFGFGYTEIASAVDRSPEAVRQMAHRARGHVQARRRRFHPDPEQSAQVTGRFLAAVGTGDVAQLLAVLSPDVVWTTDSDGRVGAARRPILGQEKVARFILGLVRQGGPDVHTEVTLYNGAPALVISTAGHLELAVSLEISEGRITHFYAFRNPEKLAAIDVPRRLAR